MAHEEDTGKTAAEHVDRAWELAEKIQFCLFTTWDGERQRMWPLTAHVGRDAHAIRFLVGVGKYGHLAHHPDVTLGFADPGASKYLVISATARIDNDRDLIRSLWSPFAKAWWDSADDPDIRVLTVTPSQAEIWDAPGKLVAGAIMLTAAVTGAKPAVGEHAKVSI